MHNSDMAQQSNVLKAGKILIAEPFLADPNFARSVVLLCQHDLEGTVGFVLNHPTQLILGDLLPEFISSTLPINQGGPVETNTLHMLHHVPEELGGNKVGNGIYWGGSYEALQFMDENQKEKDVRLFVGYSGWDPAQLETELAQGSWIVGDLNPQLLFETPPQSVWEKALRALGGEYAQMANFPRNPQLN
jgi:putative transcriptional regulator